MSNIPISSLPLAIALTGDEEVPIVQGGTTKRTTVGDIANTATGFVPTTRMIVTPVSGGLTGGGALSSDLVMEWSPFNLNTNTTMVVADSFAINDSSINAPAKVTFPNAMKAITGLSALASPSLTNDYLIINHAADGLTYKISPSSLSLAAGNVPAGGLTNQFLAKASNTNYDTTWADPAILLDAVSIAANPTGIQALSTSVTLGTTLGFVGSALQTKVGTGDVSWSANSFATTIGANKVLDSMLRQSVGLSVIGRSASTTGNVTDIVGTADQVFRVAPLGASLGFGSIDLSATAAVGSSILAGANGGTGVANTGKTVTLGGSLTTSGAFASTFTMTGITAVTFPTSGTLATTAGSSIPAIAQGDLLYGSATNTLSALSKNTTATRYLANTGTSNNPAWAQVDLTNGVTGILPGANGGTGNGFFAVSGPTTSLKTFAFPDASATVLTTNTVVTLAQGGTSANLTASNGGIFYSTASAGAILAGTATARQMLQSGASTTPAWSTTTWPATTTINRLLYSSAANVITDLATANGGILNTSASGVPSVTATPILGLAGTTVGTLGFQNATSGTVTLSPVAGALGTVTLTLPAATDTVAVLAATQAFTNKTYNGLTVTSTTGTFTVTNGKTLSISNTLTLAGTDSTTMTFPATSSTVLTTGNTATITKGFTVTPNNLGNITSFTIDPTLGNVQYGTNHGAATWTAPASDCEVDILVTNDATAGAITFSGFTVGGNTGSSLTTTNTNKFWISIRRANSISTYFVYALQ